MKIIQSAVPSSCAELLASPPTGSSQNAWARSAGKGKCPSQKSKAISVLRPSRRPVGQADYCLASLGLRIPESGYRIFLHSGTHIGVKLLIYNGYA